MTIHELLEDLREGEVPAGPVDMEPYTGALSGGKRILIKLTRNKGKRIAFDKPMTTEGVFHDDPPLVPKVGAMGFPAQLATRGVSEMNVLTRGLKFRAQDLDKMAEVLKGTGGVTMKQQAWLDRNVLHPVTRINDQLDAIKAKTKKAFFEDLEALAALMEG